MDPDPWNWTVEDVQAFFRHEGAEYICDLPGARLPPLEQFLAKLSDSDVSGWVLLSVIDPATLREDLGVSSLGVRSAILHCIGKLRRQSILYNAKQEPQQQQPQTPASLPALPEPPVLPPQTVSSPVIEAVGEHVRAGEYQVQDAQGRKRRKLDLTQVQDSRPPVTNSSTTLSSLHAHQSYLGDAKCAIDEIFFGQTPLGDVIGEMDSIGDVLIHRADVEAGLDDRNFQFDNQHKPAGESHFVFSKLRHFLMGEEAIQLKRHGRGAMAYFPYREGDSVRAPSAVVLQFRSGEHEAVAVREGFEYRKGALNFVQTSGEWDFLINEYPENEADLLPSETADEATIIATNIDDDEDGSEMAEVDEEEDEPSLNHEQMEQVIEAFIEECAENWRSRLPKLEEKRAWTIWKQMRRSRTIRDYLIHGAQRNIVRLAQRIEKMKEEYAESTWRNEELLKKACVSMEPTIEDIEELRWKISVWERKQEPGHVVGRSTQSKTSNARSGPSEQTIGGASTLHIHPDDRFSASPAPMEQGQGGVEIEDAETNDMIDAVGEQHEEIKDDDPHEKYHTPRSSRHSSPFIVNESDGMDIDSDPPLGDETLEEGASGDLPVEPTGEDAMDSESPSLKPEDDNEDSDAEGLPDISKLVLPAPKPPSRRDIQAIDLTMGSSDSEAPTKRPRGHPPSAATILNRSMQGDPAEASASTVKSWEWNVLLEKRDRMRILMKILLEAGRPFQDRTDECYRRLTSGGLIHRLRPALQAHRNGTADAPQDQGTELMAKLAPIYICWFSSCHPDREQQVLAELNDEDWAALIDRGQMMLFAYMLGSILTRKKKHFVSPQRTPVKMGSSSAPIDLSSGIETDAPSRLSARNKRKKQVKQSAVALDSRLTAHKRQQKFAESQTTDSAQLVAMLNSDPSVSHLVINPMREADDDPIHITNKIARKMKGHQVDGVQFMWREITAEEEQGCILAHTMGLGKTMQTIALLVAINESAQSELEATTRQLPKALRKASIREGHRAVRVLVLCPPTLKQNWQREIEMWAGNKLGPVFHMEYAPNKAEPAARLKEWKRHGGVVLIGYEYFRNLLARKLKKDEDPEVRAVEVKKLEKYLLDGPEIVVADEAHHIKNEGASISKLSKRFKTMSRIALTGTPMSNDVDEIYALVNWTAPGFFGDPVEFRYRFTEPIKAGLYSDSSSSEKRKSMMRLKVLHSEIGPKVDRANIEVLRGSLKSKTEFVITLPLTRLQTEMCTRFIRVLRGERSDKASQVAIFGWLSDLTILATHPHCLVKKLLAPPPTRKRRSLSEEPDLGGHSPSTATEDGIQTHEEPVDPEDEEAQQEAARLAPSEVQAIIHHLKDDFDPLLSAKITVLRELLGLCLACGDKALIFSSSLPTLDYISELFQKEDKVYGRIDGATAPAKRMKLLERFEKDEFDIMLISSKAGGVGLNIQSANRVFIMDFKWNPAVEEQAIGRAYRLGQLKPVFVYRFITGGCFETNLYQQQLFKSSLSQRVVDKKNPRRNAERNVREYLYEPKEVEQKDITKHFGKDAQVLDKALDGTGRARALIRSIDTLEVLHEDAMDAPLDEEEQKAVDEEIEWIRKHGRGAPRPMTFGLQPPHPGPSTLMGTAPYSAPMGSMVAPAAPANAWQASPFFSSTQPQPGAPYHLGGLPGRTPWNASQP